ncbi:MAG: FliI/YscN family ATPase [Leptospirales bacterium]
MSLLDLSREALGAEVERLLGRWERSLDRWEPSVQAGVVVQGIGLMIEVRGVDLGIGEICEIESRPPIPAEVVGFREGRSLLMPLGELRGVRPGMRVIRRETRPLAWISDQFLGRVLNPMGKSLDRGSDPVGDTPRSLYGEPINPMTRRRIQSPLDTRVRSLNALLTMGQGQKVGLFAGAGVGKSTLLGMMAREADIDVSVIALIGERGREVRDFLERDLGPEGLSRSVVIVSTGDQPPLLRVRGALFAMSVAEHFRHQGKSVLFVMDSLTRYAMALREIGLATGEPPTVRGYTPSVFAQLPRFIERAGASEGEGSITGIYTVLMEGEDMQSDPLSEALAAILDGHILLSRDLAAEGVYPAVDLRNSRSRVLGDLVDDHHRGLIQKFLRLDSLYRKSEDLIRVGAYVSGTDPELDRAIDLHPRMMAFLSQDFREGIPFTESVEDLESLMGEES